VRAFLAGIMLLASTGAVSSQTGDLPVWSSDGREIAFVAPTRFGFEVEVMSRSGAGRRVVALFDRTGIAAELRWAGSRRLIVSDLPSGQLRSINTTSGKVVELGGSPGGLGSGVGPLSLPADDTFAASADGRRVAYTVDSPYRNANMTSQGFIPDVFAVCVVSSSGGAGHVLPQPVHASDAYPSFSPDGSQVVFARSTLSVGVATGLPSLMIQSVNGGQARPLNIEGDRPVWSPNGRWIAYQQLTKSAGALVPRTLEIISPSGGKPRTLLNANVDEPLVLSWAPDSHRIAFITGSGKMGTATLTGKVTILKLTGRLFVTGRSVDGVPDNPPEWSPDGKTLVFAASPSSRRSETSIYVIGADARGLRRIG
jgi:Tol biopolymer transport system component